ncbi:MAG TPA: translation initiation factor [bacterium]|nr:translation initiation factor [bacterium]HPN45782.1 translation initiation factor [bacterium]
MDKNSKFVFSTNPDYSPQANEPEQREPVKKTTVQTLKIYLDKKGRKGKSVTVIEGFMVNPQHLETIARQLKQELGTGGTARQGSIEIQGDHRKAIADKLTKAGHKVKLVGS